METWISSSTSHLLPNAPNGAAAGSNSESASPTAERENIWQIYALFAGLMYTRPLSAILRKRFVDKRLSLRNRMKQDRMAMGELAFRFDSMPSSFPFWSESQR